MNMMVNAFVIVPALTVGVCAATEVWWRWTAHHH